MFAIVHVIFKDAYVPEPSAVPDELHLKVVADTVGTEYETTVTALLVFVVELPYESVTMTLNV